VPEAEKAPPGPRRFPNAGANALRQAFESGRYLSSECLESLRQAPELERMLLRSGIRLHRSWFSVTQEKQRVRVLARETEPTRRMRPG
jgi:hypothetical protein